MKRYKKRELSVMKEGQPFEDVVDVGVTEDATKAWDEVILFASEWLWIHKNVDVSVEVSCEAVLSLKFIAI